MDKQTVVQTYHGIVLSDEKKRMTDTHRTGIDPGLREGKKESTEKMGKGLEKIHLVIKD